MRYLFILGPLGVRFFLLRMNLFTESSRAYGETIGPLALRFFLLLMIFIEVSWPVVAKLGFNH